MTQAECDDDRTSQACAQKEAASLARYRNTKVGDSIAKARCDIGHWVDPARSSFADDSTHHFQRLGSSQRRFVTWGARTVSSWPPAHSRH